MHRIDSCPERSVADVSLNLDDVVDVVLDRPAHGGYSVGRVDGQVVFVRLGIPGERVRAVITEIGQGGRFVRAEVESVLDASPDRVEPSCRHAVPGGCGGCDWQQVSLPRQRAIKAEIIREQLIRVGKCDPDDALLCDLVVHPCGDDDTGFGYRTRMDFVADPRGRLGLRSARSHDVIALQGCPLATSSINDSEALHQPWAAGSSVRIASADSGLAVVPDGADTITVKQRVGEMSFDVLSTGFWQVHRNAPTAFTGLARDLLAPKPGEFLLDLYGGVGLFAGVLAPLLGAGGRIAMVEGDRAAARLAKRNLRGIEHVEIYPDRVDQWLRMTRITKVDLVVMDPPRSGAGKAVIQGVLRMRPRRLLYVACDPASLARDIAIARECDYRLTDLRAVDAFPHTAHVETFALLEPK